MSACVRPMMTGCYQHHTWSSLARFSSVVLYDPRSLAVGARPEPGDRHSCPRCHPQTRSLTRWSGFCIF